MSCCAPGAELCLHQVQNLNDEILLASRMVEDGLRQTDLSVPDIHCGACLQRIEAALSGLDRVVRARANLSTRRVAVVWRGDVPPQFMAALEALGYRAHLHDADAAGKDAVLSELLRALAVAGFAATNIMLLSASVWAGAEPPTRDLFHWISALIALPTLAYSGQFFFRSAWRSLKHGQTNMDVPISIGVLLTFGMSLYETLHHGPYAYFDAAVSLLFFLLVGRTLDHVMRERARQAVSGLARLAARGALVLQPDGTQTYVAMDEIEPGMTILLAAGERVPVNARVIKGTSELDHSFVSGESVPVQAKAGTELEAGILNLTGPLTIVATRTAANSFLADIMRMTEAAERGRASYRRIADRAARLYAPAVHALASLAFVGWMMVSGDPHRAITIAIAVLIITCPCALGLAVPMVHVVAAGRLFELGIMPKDGGALERLAEVDTAVFDKTGTLTLGRSQPTITGDTGADMLALAATIAMQSYHPYSQALATLGDPFRRVDLDAVAEHPGKGLEAHCGANVYRLGRPDWAIAGGRCRKGDQEATVAFAINGKGQTYFTFNDAMRDGAQKAVAELTKSGISAEILSGDKDCRVQDIAQQLGLPWISEAGPAEKIAHVSTLRQAGRKVLMVGDGLNDAPALTAANVSIAPASASDVGRNVADFVFLRDSLEAIPRAVEISRAAQSLVQQNFALAVIYNIVAVPFALLGLVTPIFAAIAMSLSSITVVANSLRLNSRLMRPGAPRSAPVSKATIAFGAGQ
ncbi:heavy metal translocating P-type ATPase [Bradyrhizobium sp. AS23.2]|uniref:heavy metal translocating P-type ATPase n=1 Tax=Bradyrhizobium sp. AS23.2 TaxID=1680155 RepID=UPI00093A691A|nr:heavy metal translocating P-type ATPase [Bradyrhizobium sp. AS23.2]OKO76010.1 nitrogen fixation protein FixI [Bradyrhizobium sp. AS23.2]